jgi:hypothetical protein
LASWEVSLFEGPRRTFQVPALSVHTRRSCFNKGADIAALVLGTTANISCARNHALLGWIDLVLAHYLVGESSAALFHVDDVPDPCLPVEAAHAHCVVSTVLRALVVGEHRLGFPLSVVESSVVAPVVALLSTGVLTLRERLVADLVLVGGRLAESVPGCAEAAPTMRSART